MIRKGTPADYGILTRIWEKAVVDTHYFLDPLHFDQIRNQMPEYLAAVELFIWEEYGNPIGFIGIADGNIDMLFVADRGRRIGQRLLDFATNEKGADRVDVNEQNVQAIGFYEKYGFKTVSRSDVDSAGRPYPLLHMQLKQTR